jgi:toxin-antitoxin system PIN domain toxin
MTLLPDVNVWLALASEAHAHHDAATAWLLAVSDECHFCRMTQQGFLRLSTNPRVLGDEALTMTAAWRTYDALLADDRISYVEESPDVETQWRRFTLDSSFRTRFGMTRVSQRSLSASAHNSSRSIGDLPASNH